MRANDDDAVDVEISGFTSERECGHFGFGVEIEICLTEREAQQACAQLYQVLAANMPFILGRTLVGPVLEVVPNGAPVH